MRKTKRGGEGRAKARRKPNMERVIQREAIIVEVTRLVQRIITGVRIKDEKRPEIPVSAKRTPLKMGSMFRRATSAGKKGARSG